MLLSKLEVDGIGKLDGLLSDQNCNLRDQQTQPTAANPLPHTADGQHGLPICPLIHWSTSLTVKNYTVLLVVLSFFKQNEKPFY